MEREKNENRTTKKLFFISWMKLSSWKCGAKLRKRIERVLEINNHILREGNIFKCQTKPQVEATNSRICTFILIFLFPFERMVLCRINHSHVMKSARYFQFSSHLNAQFCFIFDHEKSRILKLMFWCFWMLTICIILRYLISRMKKHRKARIISKVVRRELFASAFFVTFYVFSCLVITCWYLQNSSREKWDITLVIVCKT